MRIFLVATAVVMYFSTARGAEPTTKSNSKTKPRVVSVVDYVRDADQLTHTHGGTPRLQAALERYDKKYKNRVIVFNFPIKSRDGKNLILHAPKEANALVEEFRSFHITMVFKWSAKYPFKEEDSEQIANSVLQVTGHPTFLSKVEGASPFMTIEWYLPHIRGPADKDLGTLLHTRPIYLHSVTAEIKPAAVLPVKKKK